MKPTNTRSRAIFACAALLVFVCVVAAAIALRMDFQPSSSALSGPLVPGARWSALAAVFIGGLLGVGLIGRGAATETR